MSDMRIEELTRMLKIAAEKKNAFLLDSHDCKFLSDYLKKAKELDRELKGIGCGKRFVMNLFRKIGIDRLGEKLSRRIG